MPKIVNPHLAKLPLGKLHDLSSEMRSFAANMRRDDADARDCHLSPYAEALDQFADRTQQLITALLTISNMRRANGANEIARQTLNSTF